MKILLEKKQLDLLLSDLPENEELSEIDAEPMIEPPMSDTSSSTAATTTSSSSSTSTSKPSPYPTVGKWESGVSRGAGNQVGLTKWSDIVGSTISRGKGNQLKEQVMGTIPTNIPALSPEQIEKIRKEKELEQNFNNNYFIVDIPKTEVWPSGSVILPKEINGIKTSYGVFRHPLSSAAFFKSWLNSQWESYIPSDAQIENILPANTLRWLMIDGVRYHATLIRVSDTPLQYSFNWYVNDDGHPFNQYSYIKKEQIPRSRIKKDKTWWDKWGQWLLAGGSLLVSILVPGSAGIWIAVGLDLAAAADVLIREGDSIGAAMFAILSFLPVIGNTLKWGRVSNQTANRLAKEFSTLKTEEEIMAKVNTLPAREKHIMLLLLKEDPKRLGQIIDNLLAKKVTTKSHALRVVTIINDAIKTGKISKKSGYAWYKKLGVRRFGYEIAATGFIIASGVTLKKYLAKIKEDIIKKGFKTDLDLMAESDRLAQQIESSNADDYNSKIVPVLDKYYEKYGNNQETIGKFYQITTETLKAYIGNPNQDFNQVADGVDKR